MSFDMLCNAAMLPDIRPADLGTGLDFDSVTAEPALIWLAQQGGAAIDVRPGETGARHRVADPSALPAAIAGWIEAGCDDRTGGAS